MTSTNPATETLVNHQVRLAARPVGLPKASDWQLSSEPVAEPAEGGVLVKVLALSLDPAMRGWMNEGRSYIAPVAIGEVMRAGGIGRVIATRHPGFAVGDAVSGLTGVQEYLSLPASNAWHVSEKIPSEIAAFLDPLGNATHSALSFDLVGEDVLITGAGPIGVMAAAIARHVGAQRIVVTDVNDYRLALARRMGATLAVNVNQTSIEDARRELGIIGFDVGLEMSGNGRAFESMLENMYHGGRIALLGILPNDTGIAWDQVIFKGLVLKGIYGREIFETWYKMQTMLQSGLDVSPVLTHRLPFERFAEGFEAMRTGSCGKVVLKVAEDPDAA